MRRILLMALIVLVGLSSSTPSTHAAVGGEGGPYMNPPKPSTWNVYATGIAILYEGDLVRAHFSNANINWPAKVRFKLYKSVAAGDTLAYESPIYPVSKMDSFAIARAITEGGSYRLEIQTDSDVLIPVAYFERYGEAYNPTSIVTYKPGDFFKYLVINPETRTSNTGGE
jgi:hypothetical protein